MKRYRKRHRKEETKKRNRREKLNSPVLQMAECVAVHQAALSVSQGSAQTSQPP
jgi:hypothetical protein